MHTVQQSPVLETNALDLWDALFRAQVDTSFAFELPAFYRSSAWRLAKNIVDLGTGNGYFVLRLSAVFQDKEFVANDISRDFIELAKRPSPFSSERVNFIYRDFFDESDNFDFVILRAVAQHQPSLDKLLEKLSALVRPKGSALLIDLDEFEGVFFWPPAPEITNIYSRIAERQRVSRSGSIRSQKDLIRAVEQNGKWNILNNERVVVPSTVGDTANLLKHQFSLLLELLELIDKGAELVQDYKQAKEQWRQWCTRRSSYSHVALRIMELGRK
jgi:2-polyprenyl-3-methyl-5-hydroxy-6-metoxy-1,4-benzoquinol methylase